MRLKLIFRYDKKNDELYRRAIERVELDSALGSSKCRYDFVEPVGRAVWNGDAEPDAGAHRFLALFERGQNRVAVCGLDFAQVDEQINQFDDGRPTLGGLHLRDDLLGRK